MGFSPRQTHFRGLTTKRKSIKGTSPEGEDESEEGFSREPGRCKATEQRTCTDGAETRRGPPRGGGGGSVFSGDPGVPLSCPGANKDLQNDYIHKVSAPCITTLAPEWKQSPKLEAIKVTINTIRSFLLHHSRETLKSANKSVTHQLRPLPLQPRLRARIH